MANVKIWLMETRPHFLLITPISVLVGVSVAVYESYVINVSYLVLALVGALLAHASVNVLNDFFDHQSGLDFKTVRTPFSGGSGILTAGLISPRGAHIFGVACLVATIPIGAYFSYVHSVAIIPLGLLGLLAIYFYTTYLTRMPLVCAIVPGLGFGPLMVLGTYFALTGTYSLAAGLASIIPGFLVSNLLLLNQFPDVEADSSASRRHLPIAIGRKGSSKVYASLVLATYVALIVFALVGVLPYAALFGLFTLPLGLIVVRQVLRYYDQIEQLIPSMGQNVLLTLLLPMLMAVGIIIAPSV